jgi:hypothetical protein
VAFEAVKGLVELVHESKRGMKIDGRMRCNESFMHIMQFSGEKIDRTIFLLQGNLV